MRRDVWFDLPEGFTWLEVPLEIVLVVLVGTLVLWAVRRLITKVVLAIAESGNVLRRRTKRAIAKSGRYAPPATDPLVAARRTLRATTMAAVLRSVATLLVVLVAVAVVLARIGVDLGPLLASAGIAGIAIGFGAQALIKDYLSGIAILVEDQYGIGDVVEVGEVHGTVEDVGLRVTLVRDLDGTLWYIRNGEILKVGNRTQGWSRALVSVQVKPDEDLEAVHRALETAADAVAGSTEAGPFVLGPPAVDGFEDLTAAAVTFRVMVKTAPAKQWEVSRALREAIHTQLAAAGISLVA